MFQNVKVDVIYHKTNTDFEMEFNLCGCCRMRLLTDKTPDKKTFVHSLARAVSRSRIIIVVGSLFSDEGTVTLVGEAIKSQTSIIDNSLYGIKGEQQIPILKGATPLVTGDGFFGGCIIESGPQTMILLTENKNVRKTVMNTLIHPYIEDLYASDLRADDKTEEPRVAQTDESDMPDTMILEDLSDDEAVEEITLEIETEGEEADALAEDIETEVQSQEDENIEENETEFEAEVEVEPQEDIPDEIPMEADVFVLSNEEIYGADIEYEDIDSQTYERMPKPRKQRDFKWPILIITAIILVLLAVLCYCIFYVPSSQGVSASDYIRDIYDTLFPSTKV